MTHREIFEHLLSGGTITEEDCDIYAYLDNKGELVANNGESLDVYYKREDVWKVWVKGPCRQMNIQEATSYAERGLKICRRGWNVVTYIYKTDNRDCFYREGETVYPFGHEDLTTSDWIIYTEEDKHA